MQPSNLAANLLASTLLTGKERALTQQAWRDFNFERAETDPGYGRFYQINGQSGVGNFTSTQATTGTALWKAGAAGSPPVLELDSDSTTNTQGIQVQFPGIGVNPADGMVVYQEFILRFRDIATGPEFFAGLATLDTTILASSAQSAADWVGFQSLSGGTINFGCEDGTQDVSAITAHTMVDGDSITTGAEIAHLAIRWEVGKSFEVYVNRAIIDSSDVSIANEPDGAMVLSFVCQSNGTTDPIVEVLSAAVGFRVHG